MKKPLKFLLISGLALAGLWAAWIHFFPKSVVHYRLDVTFNVDGIPVTGSGVQKLVVHRVRGIGHQRASWRTYGEAVRVDLPGHGAIYVLMTSPTPDGTYTHSTRGRYDWLVSQACELKEKRGDRNWDEYVRMVGRVSGECDVPGQFLPLMVRFRDETDPTTVERVYPDHMDELFGGSVDFVEAKIVITNKDLSRNIEKYLPWILENYQTRLTPGFTSSESPSLADTIKFYDFWRF